MQILPDQNRRQPYHDEHLYVDLRHELVILDRQTLALTRKEYCILALMEQHAGRVGPRATFWIPIWGFVPETRTRTMDRHIDQLRKKLGPYADQYIESVGIGYRFRAIRWLPLSAASGA